MRDGLQTGPDLGGPIDPDEPEQPLPGSPDRRRALLGLFMFAAFIFLALVGGVARAGIQDGPDPIATSTPAPPHFEFPGKPADPLAGAIRGERFTLESVVPCSDSQMLSCWYECDSRPGNRLIAVQCQADTSDDNSGHVSLACTCWRAPSSSCHYCSAYNLFGF